MNQTNLRVHFVHRHVWDTVVILEEGNRTYPQCFKCGMFFMRWDINDRHPSMDLF